MRSRRKPTSRRLGLLLVTWACLPAAAEVKEPGSEAAPPTTTAPAGTEATEEQPSTGERAERTDWYVRPKSASADRTADRPDYVRTLDQSGLPGTEEFDWLDFGLEQRSQLELRDDNYRAGLESDHYFALRSRAFLGVRKIFDPLRLGFEFQDSRLFGSDFPETTGDIDEADFLQAFGELYFADALGEGQPLSFRVGRMSFDAIDRRLMSRNRFRNTTNAYDGFRLRIGELSSRWELDIFAFQPVERRLRSPDRSDEERWLYGLNWYWRGWSPHVTIEPFYFALDEDRKQPGTIDREIHTFGLRAYGLIGKTGFDYDLNVAAQLGDDGPRDHRAFATHAELGYSIRHDWKPRLAFWVNYASGDRRPGDGVSERFDSLFGSGHTFYSYMDLFTWQNMINPTLQLSLQPTKSLSFDAFYRAYWLASDADAFIRAGRVDPAGESGDCIGQEIDLRIRQKVNKYLQLEVGYAYFFPGPFLRNTGPPTDDSDFFYVQSVLQF